MEKNLTAEIQLRGHNSNFPSAIVAELQYELCFIVTLSVPTTVMGSVSKRSILILIW